MKDGKLDVKSIGITIVLSIAGTAIGLFDFFSQKVNVMNFLSEILKIRPVVNTQIVLGSDVVANAMSFSGVSLLVLVVAIMCIALAMTGIRGMG
jgi:hypothetical protein